MADRYGDLSVLDNRAGWTVNGRVATFTTDGTTWVGRVTKLERPTRAFERFHVALSDGFAVQHTRLVGTALEAIQLAERFVRNKIADG